MQDGPSGPHLAGQPKTGNSAHDRVLCLPQIEYPARPPPTRHEPSNKSTDKNRHNKAGDEFILMALRLYIQTRKLIAMKFTCPGTNKY